jgi:hypothetical protein
MFKSLLTPSLLIALVAQLALAADNRLSQEEEKEGWILLFDGKSLDGWMTSDSKPSQRHVEDGALNPHKSGHYMLVTKEEFGDLKLQLDFKLSPRCNSGVFFRVFSLTPQPGKDVGYNGIEVAIDDTKTAGYVDPGAIYDLSKPTKNVLRPLGQWNHLVLTSRDNRAIVELNGEVVNEVDFNKFTEADKRPDGTPHKFGVAFKDFPRRGRIGLQDHGADIWFKNIKLLPLDGSNQAGDSGQSRGARRDAGTNLNTSSAPTKLIWDRRLMAQQFDEKPVREIRVPDWLEGITNYCYGATAYLDESESYGVQMTELAFGDPDHLRYPSKHFQMDPRASPDDLTKQVAEVRRRGMRVIAAFTPCFQRDAYITHPEWRLIPTNTTEIPNDIDKNSYGGWLCQIGPWGDRMIEIMEEILEKYAVDGFGFDGMHHQRVCYCEHCRTHYRADTNEDIPDVDMNDSAYRRYLLWYDRQMERFIERMQERIKAKNPECALVTWTTNAGRFGHFRDIPRNMPARMNALLDCPCQEFWMDETNRGNSVVPAFGNAYLWATTNHRVASNDPYIMSHGNPYGQDSFPPHEVERRALLVLTHGSQVSIATGWGPRILPAVWRVLSLVEERQPWLTQKKPEPWAALVMSDNTRNFYGRDPGQVEERYLAHVLGAYRAALEEHLPLAVINDWNLNEADLAPYKVLILANAAALNDGQVKAIREFVNRGGGLVATADTSLFGETGDERDNFALADVFGVDFAGVTVSEGRHEELDANFKVGLAEEYWQKRKSVFELTLQKHEIVNHPRLDEYVGDTAVTFKGPALSIKKRADAPKAQTIATMRPWRKPEPNYPALVTNQYGNGRVVYISAGLDAAYYVYPYPYQRLVLAQSMRWAAAAPPPIEVEAPMCVHATCFRQTAQGERLVVHLYNDINTTGNHALPDEDVPLREEVLPIYTLRVTFRPDYQITRAHLEPGNVELETNRTAVGTSVTVQRLDIHRMIIAELE